MTRRESFPRYFDAPTAHAFRATCRISSRLMLCFRRCALRWFSSAPERHRLNVARSSGRSPPPCFFCCALWSFSGLATGLFPFSDNARTSGGNRASSAFLYAFQSFERTTTAAKRRSRAQSRSSASASAPACSVKHSRKTRRAAQCPASISSVSGSLASASATLCSAILARRRAERSTAASAARPASSDPSRGAANSSASPSMPSARRCSYTHRPGARSTTLGEGGRAAATIAFVAVTPLRAALSCVRDARTLGPAGFHLRETGSSGQVLRNSRRRTRLLAYPGRAARRKTRAGPWTCRDARRAANSGGSSACVSRRAGARGCGVREMRDVTATGVRRGTDQRGRRTDTTMYIPRGQKKSARSLKGYVVQALPWSKISGFPIPDIGFLEFPRMARQSETER